MSIANMKGLETLMGQLDFCFDVEEWYSENFSLEELLMSAICPYNMDFIPEGKIQEKEKDEIKEECNKFNSYLDTHLKVLIEKEDNIRDDNCRKCWGKYLALFSKEEKKDILIKIIEKEILWAKESIKSEKSIIYNLLNFLSGDYFSKAERKKEILKEMRKIRFYNKIKKRISAM